MIDRRGQLRTFCVRSDATIPLCLCGEDVAAYADEDAVGPCARRRGHKTKELRIG